MWVKEGELLEAVTVTDIVPLGVEIKVGTLSVAVEVPVTELGLTVHVTPDGQPEVTERLTVAVRVDEYCMVSVYVAVPPAATDCEVGDAVIVKSLGGGPVE